MIEKVLIICKKGCTKTIIDNLKKKYSVYQRSTYNNHIHIYKSVNRQASTPLVIIRKYEVLEEPQPMAIKGAGYHVCIMDALCYRSIDYAYMCDFIRKEGTHLIIQPLV